MTLAAVMTFEPDLNRLPDGLSPAFRTYLVRCLEKDPRERVRDIGDVRLALKGAFETTVSIPSEPVAVPQLQVWQRPIPLVLGVLLLVVLSGLAVWSLARPTPQAVTRFEVPLRAEESFTGTGRHIVAAVTGWSPDRLHHGGWLVAPVTRSGDAGAGGGH